MQHRSPSDLSVRSLRLRLKDRHAAELLQLAREVNFVWNYVNELSFKVWQRERRFLSAYDVHAFTAGATKEGLRLHSQTVQAINEEYVTRRKQHKKVKLRWRKSGGARRSLGWIPLKKAAICYRAGQVWISGMKRPLSLWDSYGLADYEFGSGCISEDARGRWYLNVTIKVEKAVLSTGRSALGIDLGLKEFAATSTAERVEAQRFYRDLEHALALAQRANKRKRTKSLHAKISNRRKDFLHQLSRRLVNDHGAIFVGNVNASALAQTKQAKSVLDAGWSTFRTMLQYKCDDAGVWFEEVDEKFSTQDCSVCGARHGPKGLAGLTVRSWVCPDCGTELDRDVNAARNILARGLRNLESRVQSLESSKEQAGAAEAKADETALNKTA